MTKLPPIEPAAIEELKRRLNFIENLIRAGEEPNEIESLVNDCAHFASVWFFGWLVNNGYDDASQILGDMSRDFVKFIYLDEEVARPRSRSLASASKNRLAEFINLIDFAVSEDEWKSHFNPFDGLILFYEFLDNTIGYPADAPRRKRAIEEIRKSSKKRPCSTPQPGYALTQ